MKQSVYEKITAKIVADLEQGVRPWLKPWNAEHAAGRITRPLRSNGTPYRGINILMLWMQAMERGYPRRRAPCRRRGKPSPCCHRGG